MELLDGIQNLLPHGLTRRFQAEYSTLADGYKESELEPATGLGLFKLSSIPADRPEPNEALRATTVWSEGIEPARRLLCSAQLDRFRRGSASRRGNTDPRPARRVFRQYPAGASCGRPQRVEHGGGGGSGCCARRGCSAAPQVWDEPARAARRRRRTRHARTWFESWPAPTASNSPATNLRPGGTSRTPCSTPCAVEFPIAATAISRSDFKAFIAKASRAVSDRQAAFLDALARNAASHATYWSWRARSRTRISSAWRTSTCR